MGDFHSRRLRKAAQSPTSTHEAAEMLFAPPYPSMHLTSGLFVQLRVNTGRPFPPVGTWRNVAMPTPRGRSVGFNRFNPPSFNPPLTWRMWPRPPARGRRGAVLAFAASSVARLARLERTQVCSGFSCTFLAVFSSNSLPSGEAASMSLNFPLSVSLPPLRRPLLFPSKPGYISAQSSCFHAGLGISAAGHPRNASPL